MKGLEDIFSDIVGKDKQSIEIVKEILKKKMKPEGSLGILEELVQKMAGIYSYPFQKFKKNVTLSQ